MNGNNPHPHCDELLTVRQVMNLAKVGRTKVWAEMSSGALKSITIGRCRRVRLADYRQWIDTAQSAAPVEEQSR